MAKSPRVSVVVAARNDDHGGNMLGRMQAFLDSWAVQARRYRLASEIVVVEWNPPEERPRLAEVLSWPEKGSPCSLRFIEVPPEIHCRLPHAEAIPLHQMIAKNAGIRRARGEFVLATNLDIVFSSALMEFLASHPLEDTAMYRIDRHDVGREIPRGAVEDLLQYCEAHVLRVFTREGELIPGENGLPLPKDPDIVHPESGIRLGAGWFEPEAANGQVFRWMEPEAEIVFLRPEAPALLLEMEPGPSAAGAPVVLETAGDIITVRGWCRARIPVARDAGSGRLRLRVKTRGLPVEADPRFLHLRVFRMEWQSGPAGVLAERPAVDWSASAQAVSLDAGRMRNAAYLHTNACGDFTLLSRASWFALRGYPELPIWPMHLDALLCYAAHHGGNREIILREPLRIYHVEHASGAGWSPAGDEELAGRIDRVGVPQLSYAEFVSWVNEMRKRNAPVIFNGPDWGLGGVELAETW